MPHHKMSDKDHIESVYRDMFKYLPFKIVPAVSGILVIFILASNLSLHDYGKYSSLIVLVTLISQLAGAWLYSSVLYVYPKYSSEKGEIFRNKIGALQLLVLIPFLIISSVVIYFFSKSILITLLISLILYFQIFNSLIYSFLQSSGIVNSQSKAVTIQSMLQILLLIAFFYLASIGISLALTALALSLFASFIYISVMSKLSHRSIFKNLNGSLFDFPGFREVLTYGIPMSIWFFSMQFFTFGDRILLFFYNVKEDIGLYSSYRDLMTGGFSLISMPLLLASHPIIMRMWNNNRISVKEIENVLSNNITVIASLFLPVIIFIRAFGYVIFDKWLKFTTFNREIVTLIMLSIMLSALALYAQKGLEVAGRTKIMAKIAFTIVLISLLTNLILVPFFGILGMAYINMFSQLLYLVIIYIFSRNHLKMKIRLSSFLTIILFCILMKVILYVIGNLNPVILIVIFISITLVLFMFLPETRVLATGIFKRERN